MAIYWATLKIYNPFVMGGSVWSWHRYKVEGEPCKVGPFKGFYWYSKCEKKWVVHEFTTGNRLGEGRSLEKAKANAFYNVSITDDLKDQIKDTLKEWGCKLSELPMLTTKESERLRINSV